MKDNRKDTLSVIQASSLRELVEMVNEHNNQGGEPIQKEDVVTILKENEAYFMLYYR